MLKRGKVRDAANAVPRKLAEERQVLAYLHRRANTSRTSPQAWKNHRHQGDREKIFACTAKGLEMRPTRLTWLLEEVVKVDEEERPDTLSDLLLTMASNSKRSEDQKRNASRRRSASAVVRPPRRRK